MGVFQSTEQGKCHEETPQNPNADDGMRFSRLPDVSDKDLQNRSDVLILQTAGASSSAADANALLGRRGVSGWFAIRLSFFMYFLAVRAEGGLGRDFQTM
jgi:hypothetical protein